MRLLTASCLFLIATAAQAQTPPVPAPKATAEEIAKAKAAGDALLARDQVGDLFTNTTDGASISLTHKPSGLVCGFDVGDPVMSIRLYPNPVRGDDVSCGSKIVDFVVTLYATHVGPTGNADALMKDGVAAIKSQHPDLKPYQGQSVRVAGASAPLFLSARFVYGDGDQAVYTRISLAVENGWMYEERISGPASKAMSGDVLGEIYMATTLLRVNQTAKDRLPVI